jgi:hypothetical protein
MLGCKGDDEITMDRGRDVGDYHQGTVRVTEVIPVGHEVAGRDEHAVRRRKREMVERQVTKHLQLYRTSDPRRERDGY